MPATSTAAATSLPRPNPRLITELPPPSQLDIEWSPVLTRTNERILKLGNLVVTTGAQPHSPSSKTGEGSTETPKKFSRFFGGGGTAKKRQRLVMVTSSARIVIAAAGGDEKKAKMEVSLLSPGCCWNSYKDTKGLTYFCVDTVTHLCFNLLAITANPSHRKTNTSSSKIPKQPHLTQTAPNTAHRSGWRCSSGRGTSVFRSP